MCSSSTWKDDDSQSLQDIDTYDTCYTRIYSSTFSWSCVPCTALPPPRYGYYYVDRGSGVSLGSVLVYWCQEGYQLMGSERLACLRRESTSSWSHPPPHCQEGPGQAQEVRPWNLMRFDKTKCKVLHQGCGNSWYQYRLRDERIKSSPAKDFGVLVDERLDVTHPCVLAARAAKHVLGCIKCSVGSRQQHRRKVRGGWKHDSSTPERGRNAFGRLKHYHRRDYHLSALSSSMFPGAFAGCSNVAFQSSPENQPKLPLESWHPDMQALPQLLLQPSTGPITTLPSQLPRNILLPTLACRADLPRDLVPLYYRSYEEHEVFSKTGMPV
ncbi:hypothetical protein WISP_144396 [Willisornis vidua]|uniref:Sushi domain-containing protein n=1 Tax=Willisornis vidua TaxID=1566151 RepID=A0ABQ9CLA5_9PASS|nr:hypothetical protein WISP_144396 [Willisornis vidua]